MLPLGSSLYFSLDKIAVFFLRAADSFATTADAAVTRDWLTRVERGQSATLGTSTSLEERRGMLLRGQMALGMERGTTWS